ncbi:MAG: hypothetical protein KGZ25_03130, partial [Planctomycetes bacterium]|nr:hypothetical protein [Planctomycetota bacterium]
MQNTIREKRETPVELQPLIGIEKLLWGLLLGLLVVSGPLRADELLLDSRDTTLKRGSRIEMPFEGKNERPVLLWIHARIAIPDIPDEELPPQAGRKKTVGVRGDYSLKIKLNDSVLGPDKIQVLNKRTAYDWPEENKRTRGFPTDMVPVPIFDAETELWYLRAARKWSRRIKKFLRIWPGRFYRIQRSRGAHDSCNFEYLLRIPGELLKNRNQLVLSNHAPENRKYGHILLKSVRVLPADSAAVPYARPWEEDTFRWQAPDAESLLVGGKALETGGAAPGEYRPATLSLFALRDLQEVRLSVSALDHTEKKERIEPSRIHLYSFHRIPSRPSSEELADQERQEILSEVDADMTKIAQSMEPGQRPDAEELSVDIVEKEAS